MRIDLSGTRKKVLVAGIGLMLAGAAAPDTADRCRGIARERQERLSPGALEAPGASSRRR